MSIELFRQGDVLVRRCKKPAEQLAVINRDDRGRLILAEGEATGHHHAISDMHAQLFGGAEPGKCYLLIEDAPAVLGHEEHAPITIGPGWYEVIRQREYSPGATRKVTD